MLSDIDVFVDVGASHGVYTHVASRALRSGKIISIEADPERYEILRANASNWQQQSSAVIECLNLAVSDSKDSETNPTVEFFITGTQISGGLFPVPERSDAYKAVQVAVTTLDEIVPDNQNVFVKIDVEGGELRVLKGAEQLLARGTVRFFIELSWWGDRQRKTSVLTTLRFLFTNKYSVERRLRSDYLAVFEPKLVRRAFKLAKVLPALLPRYAFNLIAPQRLRLNLIRRQNKNRLQAGARALDATT